MAACSLVSTPWICNESVPQHACCHPDRPAQGFSPIGMLANVNYIAHHAMQNNRKLKILVGTMTNTAEYVAQAIEMDCADRANRVDTVEVLMMDGLDIGIFEEDALYVICTSTYGAGDVPDNAKTLYESLAKSPRFLGSVRYGVIALGDSAYPQTFCHGGQRFDESLCDLGAVRVGAVFRHDASAGTDAETEGVAWFRQWLPMALDSH
jgi:MioC protein